MMPWVIKSLAEKGGRAHFIEIAKDIWAEHRSDRAISSTNGNTKCDGQETNYQGKVG
jgi:hypothetical protein